jgi:hypothetical protein
MADDERSARQAMSDATNAQPRVRSCDTLRSHMNIPPMNMDLDHEGGSPWDGEQHSIDLFAVKAQLI